MTDPKETPLVTDLGSYYGIRVSESSIRVQRKAISQASEMPLSDSEQVIILLCEALLPFPQSPSGREMPEPMRPTAPPDGWPMVPHLRAWQNYSYEMEAYAQSLAEALRRLLEAGEHYAQSAMTAQVAAENFSQPEPEFKAMTRAMVELSEAEKDARAILDTARRRSDVQK